MAKGEFVSLNIKSFQGTWLFPAVLLLAVGCGSNGQGSPVAAAESNYKTASSTETSNTNAQAKPSPILETSPNTPLEDQLNVAPKGLFISLPPLPGGSRARHQLTASGAALIITGGIAGDEAFSAILAFRIDKGIFEILPVSLLKARFGHTATAVPGPDAILGTRDDGILIIGGYNGKNAVASVELIHPDPNKDGSFKDARIESLTDLPFGLADHGSILATRPENETQVSSVLITSGMAFTSDSTNQSTNSSVEVSQRGVAAVTNASLLYKISYQSDGQARGEIQSIPQPQFARRGHCLTLLPGPDGEVGSFDDQILVTGGLGYNIANLDLGVASQIIDSPEIYEPSLDRWTTVTLLGERDLKRGRSSHRAILTSKGLLLIGGISENGPILTCVFLEIEAQDPSLAEVHFAGKLKQAREHPEIAFLGDMIFVVGGFNENLDSPLDSVETFNPKAKRPSFQKHSARLGTPRVFHAMAEFDNKLIITGGYTQPGLLTEPDAEFYNPVRAVK
jgi:hypothetical protein